MNDSKPHQQSIFSSVVVPIIVLLLFTIGLFLSIMGASGVFGRLNQNNNDILAQQVLSRKDNLENYLVGTVGDLRALSTYINERTQDMLDAGELDLQSMDTGANETNALMRELVPELVSAMRAKRVTGIFVIFNTHSLADAYQSNALGKKPGMYIRDMDPSATPSARNEDLVIARGSADVVESSSITTDVGWKPLFDFVGAERVTDYDFFYLPWQTAFDAPAPKDASDFAYWGISPSVGSDGLQNMAYTMPLILADGTVYGLIGVDISTKYMQTLLPYPELSSEEDGSYILGIIDTSLSEEADQTVRMQSVVKAGNPAVVEDIEAEVLMRPDEDDDLTMEVDKESYFVDYEAFRLYNTNAPFEHKQWVLAGAVPEDTLHRFSNQVLLMIGFAGLLMLLVGVLGSLVIGRRLSNPIKALAQDVENAQIKKAEMPELAKTGITEVDSLTGAIMALSKDIASVKQLEQQRIEHERDFDLLTGLMNRRALYREAEKIFADPQRVGHAALVMLDLDNLKDFNDQYGHDWGDKYIYQAARCFEAAVPGNVLVSRVAGDEFFVLFYGYDSREALESDIEQLRVAIPAKQVLLPGGAKAPISASGGAAFYPDDSRELTELMRLADFAMYQVKIEGKNNIAAFDAAHYERTHSIQQAEAELNELLTNTDLSEYHFQPIFDAHTGQVFAYEALMRVSMEHLRSPEDVLTLARQEGRLAEIEELTWKRTFECYTQLYERQEVGKGERLFINSFANIAIEQDKCDALARQYPKIMQNLVIEITEAENMNDDAMDAKRSISGFSGDFALDDYGSGYNSEIMLLDLKPKYVKVDISIIRDIDMSTDKQRIVSNVVAYAHERDMLIIAEGVESQRELATLLELNVDYFQGFYLARPARIPGRISAEALAQIQEWNQA